MSIEEELSKLQDIVSKIRKVKAGDIILDQDDNLKTDSIKQIHKVLKMMSDRFSYGDYLSDLESKMNKLYYVKNCPLTIDQCIKIEDYFVKPDLHNTFIDCVKAILNALKNVEPPCKPIETNVQEIEKLANQLSYVYYGDLVTSKLHNTLRQILQKQTETIKTLYQQCYKVVVPVKFPASPNFLVVKYFTNDIYKIYEIIDPDYKNDEEYLGCYWEHEKETCTYYGTLYEHDIYAKLPHREEFELPLTLRALVGPWFYGVSKIDGERHAIWYVNFMDVSSISPSALGEPYYYEYVYLKIEDGLIKRVTHVLRFPDNRELPCCQLIFEKIGENSFKITYKGNANWAVYDPYDFEYIDNLNYGTRVKDYATEEYYYDACIICEFYFRKDPNLNILIPDFEYSSPILEDYSKDILLYQNNPNARTFENVGKMIYTDQMSDLYFDYDGTVGIEDVLKNLIYVGSPLSSEGTSGKLFLGKEGEYVKRVTFESVEGYISQVVFNPDSVKSTAVNAPSPADFLFYIFSAINSKYILMIDHDYYSPYFPNNNLSIVTKLKHIPPEVFEIY